MKTITNYKITIIMGRTLVDKFAGIQSYISNLPEELKDEFKMSYKGGGESDPYAYYNIRIEINPTDENYDDEKREKVVKATQGLMEKILSKNITTSCK